MSMDTMVHLQPISQTTGTIIPGIVHYCHLAAIHVSHHCPFIFTGTMPCCASCGLPIQDHQLPTGARCSILSNEALNASGLKLECTVCLQPCTRHPQGKHIPKDCKFCQQQASGDTATDDLDPAEDGDIHSRLACITQENHAIKAQLSEVTELVWQLLPQPAQATPQSTDAGSMPPASSPVEDQAAGTPGASLGLPPPSWSHPRDAASGVSPKGHQATPQSPAGQPLPSPHGNPLPAAPAPLALPDRQAGTHYRGTAPASLGFPG